MNLLDRRLAGFLFALLLTPVVQAQDPALESLKVSLMCNCGCPHQLGQCGDECGIAPQLIEEVKGLLATQSEAEVSRTMEARYGKIILSAPRVEGWGVLAWILPVFALAFGGLIVWGAIQRHRPQTAPAGAALQPEIEEKYRNRLRQELQDLEG